MLKLTIGCRSSIEWSLSHFILCKFNSHASSIRGKEDVSLKGIHSVCCISNILWKLVVMMTMNLRKTKIGEEIDRMSYFLLVFLEEVNVKGQGLTVYSTKATGAPPLLCILSRQKPGKLHVAIVCRRWEDVKKRTHESRHAKMGFRGECVLSIELTTKKNGKRKLEFQSMYPMLLFTV